MLTLLRGDSGDSRARMSEKAFASLETQRLGYLYYCTSAHTHGIDIECPFVTPPITVNTIWRDSRAQRVVQLSLSQPVRPIFISHPCSHSRNAILDTSHFAHLVNLEFRTSSIATLELVDVEDASFQSDQGAHDSRYGEFFDN